ncbi:hypothetical protein ALT_9466 [Aspergillus lentulus]|uniref:Uncharacterized protein n=1 Tax=Aspergillus lentulus TaxID=293939 RepID=A0AAN4PSB6_ASPLE|nr:hypothetical protein CNMCM6069_007885 [Aspergillus lentulus]GAQ12145.1 hypothetical protein ALT_9466 [Aspergillus lentulus]
MIATFLSMSCPFLRRDQDINHASPYFQRRGLPLRRSPGSLNWSGAPPDPGGGAHSRRESCRTPGFVDEQASIFELFRRDDEDTEDDDDNLSVASEHMDVDDHIAAGNMERFCIRVSNIVETFFSIASEAGDIPESAALFRALQQYDQVELSQEVISLFPKRVRVLLRNPAPEDQGGVPELKTFPGTVEWKSRLHRAR